MNNNISGGTPQQTQAQISLQKLDTKQSVVNSLGMFLAIAEGYLISKGIKLHPLFAYYDHFHVTSEKPELIRIKLMNNYMSYSAQKQNYLHKYQTYDFYPDNLSPEKIRNIIQEWITYAIQIGEDTLYMNIFKLFDDDVIQNNYSYYNDIQGYKDNYPHTNTTVDPRNHAKANATFQSFKEDEKRKNRDKWKNTGKQEINIILGGKSGTSTLSENMKSITDQNPKQVEEELRDIEMMKNMTLSIIEKAKDLYVCSDKNERKLKRKELKVQYESTKQAIKTFKKKYGNLEGLWQKIKYSEINGQLSKIMNACEEEDRSIFQKIDALYDPEL